jgi:hypothetical protein
MLIIDPRDLEDAQAPTRAFARSGVPAKLISFIRRGTDPFINCYPLAARTIKRRRHAVQKRNRKRRTGDVSGVAITLLSVRDRIASLETAEYRKKAGELIASAARSSEKRRKRNAGSTGRG